MRVREADEVVKVKVCTRKRATQLTFFGLTAAQAACALHGALVVTRRARHNN